MRPVCGPQTHARRFGLMGTPGRATNAAVASVIAAIASTGTYSPGKPCDLQHRAGIELMRSHHAQIALPRLDSRPRLTANSAGRQADEEDITASASAQNEANPLDPANLADLQNFVIESGADIGLAFDGDADRCFFIDERGEPVPPSAIVGLVAARELARHPGSAVVHNVITSAAATEIIRENGGRPVRSRVGHSYMKALMAEHDAVFGGEHSGHYYFRDFWRADTGMLTALHVLSALGSQDRPLSELSGGYTRYVASGEINSHVEDVPAKLDEVETAWTRPGVSTDRLDGLTVTLGDGRWFNLRPSNTEPLLRLNVEAPGHDTMAALRDEVLALVRP